MRKIICQCGGATFKERYALYDATNKRTSKEGRRVKDAFGYICDQCGIEWHGEEIEWFVVQNIDPKTLEPMNDKIILNKKLLEGYKK